MKEADSPFARLGTLADPVRGRLLFLLDRHELTVSELTTALQLPQSTVSRHLRVLADDGWVAARADGTSHLYRLAGGQLDAGARRLWQLVREQMAGTMAAAADAQRLGGVLAERRTRSQDFFSRAAGQWDSLRAELFGMRPDLGAALAFLDEEWTVGDLGCGTGQLAAALAPFVRRVVAVDQSKAMLAAARRRLTGLANVDLRQGDLEALPIEDGELDAAALYLVLHYAVEPAHVLAEGAPGLEGRGPAPRGRHGPARSRGVPPADGPPLDRLFRGPAGRVARGRRPQGHAVPAPARRFPGQGPRALRGHGAPRLMSTPHHRQGD